MAATQAKTTPIDPARDALAQAIARHADAKAKAAAVRRAKDGFWELQSNAEDEVATAEAALPLAQADAVGGSICGKPILSPRDARENLQDTRDRLTAVVASEPRIGQQVIDAQSALSMAQSALKNRDSDVVKNSPAIANLLSDYETMKASMAVMRQALRFLDGRGALPPSAKFWECERPIDLSVAKGPWRAALEALETNAYAPLPS
jgi:hypothetical protein